MTSPSSSARLPDDVDAELDRRDRTRRSEQLDAFPPDVLAAFALLPEWTESLAVRLSHVNIDVIGRMKSLAEQGLVETRPVLLEDGTEETAFWLHPAAREEVGAYLRWEHQARLSRRLNSLLDSVWNLAEPLPGPYRYWGPETRADEPARRRFAAAVTESFAAVGFPALGDWVLVAADHLDDPSGLRLLGEVSRRIEAGAVPDAARLAATARVVGDVLGGHLADSARRAGWRVARAEQEAEDAHFLRHYLRRRAIEEALEESILGGRQRGTGPDRVPDGRSSGLSHGAPIDEWATHLLGEGGMGKTMLVRYLTSGRFARDRREKPFPVARVDFDYLDPRYPEDRPGEILLALAGELLGFVESRDAEARYLRFREAVDHLHEELSRRERLVAREDPLLEGAVATFARFLGELPGPVVLILDTCEELAKLYPPRAPAPAIEITFRILELIRARMPAVRVVLAGRRWLVPPPSPEEASSGPLLQPRDYVRVVPVAGFSRDEAAGYLASRAVPERQLAPILARAEMSPQAGAGPAAAAGEPLRGEVDLFNPFDLATYAEWALSDPDVDLSGTAGDPYVERRVIGRLTDPGVVRSLAVAAALGRFDRRLITPALDRLELDADEVFDGLAAQEWVRVIELGAAGRPSVIEVDENLRDRLLAVTATDPARFPLSRNLLGRDAASAIDSTPVLDDVPVFAVLAAVRLLSTEDAGRLWQRIEARAVREDAWAWAAQVSARAAAAEHERAAAAVAAAARVIHRRHEDLVASAEAAGTPRPIRPRPMQIERGVPTILAAILATQAASRIHTGGGAVAEIWRQVGRYASRHPFLAEPLADRAILGQAAAGQRVPFLAEYISRAIAGGRAPAGSVLAAVDGWMLGGAEGSPVGVGSAELRLLARDAVLLAEPGRPHRVSVAPDGTWLATTSDDHTVRLWNTDGTPRATLPGHTGIVIAPNSAWFATWSGPGTIRLWRPDDTLSASVIEVSQRIADVAIAPDSTWLATTAEGGSVLLWNADGTLRASLSDGTVDATGVAIAPDGMWLASGFQDGVVRLWNADGSSRARIAVDGTRLTRPVIAPDGTWLAVLADDGSVCLWNADGTPRARIAVDDTRLTRPVIAPDGTWLATLQEDGTAHLWNADGTLRATCAQRVDRLFVAPDSTWFVTVSRELRFMGEDFEGDGFPGCAVQLWNADGTPRARLPIQAWQTVGPVVIAPDGTWLATVLYRTVTVWDTHGARRMSLPNQGEAIADVTVAPDGAWLVTGTQEGSVRLWNTDRVVVATALTQAALLALREGAGQAELLAEAATASAWNISKAAHDSRWADWLPPKDTHVRARLARLFIAAAEGGHAQALAQELLTGVSWPDPPSDTDTDRLFSLALHILARHGPPALRYIQDLSYAPGNAVTHWLHEATPPLVVVTAQCLALHGMPEGAAQLLNAHIQGAVAAGDDPDTVQHCQIALLRLCRRFRTLRYFPRAGSLAMSGSPLVRAEAWITLTLVEGRQPSTPEEAGSWHGWWQCQDRRSLGDSEPEWPPVCPEPGIPAKLTEESAQEYVKLYPRARPVDLPKSGAFEPDLDRMAPGSRGRSTLARAEVLALRFPAEAAELLMNAVTDLEEAEDTGHAVQARLLAALAKARAVERDEREPGATLRESISKITRGLPADGGIRTEPMAPLLTVMYDHEKSGWWARMGWVFEVTSGIRVRNTAHPECPLPSGTPAEIPANDVGRTSLINLRWILAAGMIGGLVIIGVGSGWWQTLGAVMVSGVSLLVLLDPPRRSRVFPPQAMTLHMVPGEVTGVTVKRLLYPSPNSWGHPWRSRLRRWILRRPSDSSETVEDVRIPDPGAGLSGDDRAEPATRQDLLDILSQTGESPYPQGRAPQFVCLDIFSGLDHGPWEQWLGRHSSPDVDRMPLWFRSLGDGPEREWRRDWGAMNPPVFFGPRHLGPSGAVLPDPTARLQHVIGAPVATADGWRLRVETEDGPRASSVRRAENPGREGRLIGSADLGPGEVPLIVLQAEPVDGPPRSLEDQREGFVAFARDLIAEGARAVLIIPPLPDEVAAGAVRLCREHLGDRRRQPGPRTCLRVLTPLRHLIAAAEGRHEGERALFDLIMFLPR
ncbi:hypothetical protein [Planotetraspora sp. GP83]|uniref:hypothetical protein n=1 Tax=Planotetraspora sp. GP83 TaxID=3156264 RepID=UPI003512E763